MSCRSTSGGRAASSCATALTGGSAGLASELIHAMKHESAVFLREKMSIDPASPTPVEDVLAWYDELEFHVRNNEQLSDRRRAAVMQRIALARADTVAGVDVPDMATFLAWSELAGAMGAAAELERRDQGREQGVSHRAEAAGNGEASGGGSSVETASMAGASFHDGAGSTVTRAGESESLYWEPLDVFPYHRKFSRFHRRTLEATRALFTARPSTLSREEVDGVFKEWIRTVSDAYEVPVPRLVWSEDLPLHGLYVPSEQTLYMQRASITTLLHEYRHHLQAQGKQLKVPTPQEQTTIVEGINPEGRTRAEMTALIQSAAIEYDAYAWSMSLYHKLRPEQFKRMVRAGRIHHISPDVL